MARGDTTGPIVQLRRRVKAGAAQIFDLWTKPDLMVRWMSPFPGAVDCKASCDLRPGGAFSLVMSSEESAAKYPASMCKSTGRVSLCSRGLAR